MTKNPLWYFDHNSSTRPSSFTGAKVSMNTKTIAFSDVTPCCLVDRNQCFGRPAVSICCPKCASAPAQGIPLAREEQNCSTSSYRAADYSKTLKGHLSWCYMMSHQEDCNLNIHHHKSQNIVTHLITNVSSKTERSSQHVSASSMYSKQN